MAQIVASPPPMTRATATVTARVAGKVTVTAAKPRPEPFRDAQDAWFWTMAALVARRERSPRGVDGAGPPRPAVPDDVLRCLDNLYRQRRIDLVHARVLRRWGERGVAPDIFRPGERSDARLWREALDRLEGPLRTRGIVDPGPDLR